MLNEKDREHIKKIKEYNKLLNPIEQIGFSSICGLDDLVVEIAPTQFGSWNPDMKLPDASSYQSLFYGTSYNLFSNKEEWSNHLKLVDSIAQNNSCPYLVLGSPSSRSFTDPVWNQIKNDLKMAEYYLAAVLNKQDNQTLIGLEANPEIYNCNVCTDAYSTINVVLLCREFGNENVFFHLDSGCLRANGEIPNSVMMSNLDIIRRIHISEPNLAPYSGGEGELIKNAIDNKIGISLEQKPTTEGGWSHFLQQVASCL